MILKIDGVDYSNSVEVSGYTVIPRKITGPAEGYLIDGEHIADLVSLKKDLKVKIVATQGRDTASISSACSKEYVELEFNDPFTNTHLSATYEPTIENIEAALEDSNRGIYWYGFSIKFTQK